MTTNLPGLFAGGDCATGAATVVEAVAAGRKGAYAIHAYLRGPASRPSPRPLARPDKILRDRRHGKAARPQGRDAGARRQARVAAFRSSSHVGHDDNDGAFAEVELGLADDAAETEAERCLQCVCQAAGSCSLQKYSLEYGAGTTAYTGKPVRRQERVFEPLVRGRSSSSIARSASSAAPACEFATKFSIARSIRRTRRLSGAGQRHLQLPRHGVQQLRPVPRRLPDRRAEEPDRHRSLPKAGARGPEACAVFAAPAAGSSSRPRTTGSLRSTARRNRAPAWQSCVKGRFGMDFVQHPTA